MTQYGPLPEGARIPRPAGRLASAVTGLGDPVFWGLFIVLTLAAAVAGTPSAIAVNLLAIGLVVPAALIPGALAALVSEPLIVLFGGAFAVLAACFAVGAEAPEDLAYLANFLPLLLAAPVYLFARRHRGRRLAGWVAVLCLVGSALAAGVAITDLAIRGLPRASGYFTNANVFARMAVTLGFLAAAGVFVFPGRWWRLAFCAGPALGTLAAFLAGTRSVLLAVPVLALIFLVLLLKDRRQQARWWVAAGLVLAGAGLLYLAATYLDTSRLLATFHGIIDALPRARDDESVWLYNDLDTSAAFRADIYAAGWELFLRSPLIGHGWAAMGPLAAQIVPAADNGELANFHFHNDVVNFAVSAGLVGVACLLAVLAAPLASVWRSTRDDLFAARRYAATALVALTVVSGLFDTTLGYDLPTAAFAFFAALIAGGWRTDPGPRAPTPNVTRKIGAGAAGME